MTRTFGLEGEYDKRKRSGNDPDFPNTPSPHIYRDLPWFMSVSLSQRPRCFGCGGRMLSKVVTFSHGFALCEDCALTDWSNFHGCWRAIESLGSDREISRSRGITFWTPPVSLPDHDAFLRWLELWTIMRDTRDPAPALSGTDGC